MHTINTMFSPTVVILGAGFSCPMGLPDLQHIKGEIERQKSDSHNWLLGGKNRKELTVREEILNHWNSVGGDAETYGKALLNNRTNGSKPWYKAAFSQVLIRGFELAMQSQDEQRRRKAWSQIYRQFVRDIGPRPDIVVATFNQDLIVDQALLQENYCPEYCLGPKDVEDIGEHHRKGNPVRFLKPNGSMNWYICDEQSCPTVTVKWDPGHFQELPGNWGTGQERHKKHLPNSSLETALRFLMLPPGGKDLGTLLPQVEHVHKHLRHAVLKAKRIFFIGWSAPDTDKDWVARLFQNTKAKVQIVDICNDGPEGNRLKKRYEAVVGKNRIGKCYFGKINGDVERYPNSYWRTDFLATNGP